MFQPEHKLPFEYQKQGHVQEKCPDDVAVAIQK